MTWFDRSSTQFLVGALVVAAGLAAGGWNANRVRAVLGRALVEEARRGALVFRAEDLQTLGATPADLGRPAYLALKSRLVQLRRADPRIRYACVLRHQPGPDKLVFVADSEPPDSPRLHNPGDEFHQPDQAHGLRSILRGARTVFDGPWADGADTWVGAFAIIDEAMVTATAGAGAPARDALGLILPAAIWRQTLGLAGLQAAGFTWLLLGLPVGGLLAFRRMRGQGDLIRKLTQAIEQSRSGVLILGPDRRIEHVNSGLCAITGWRRAELAGQPAHLLTSGDAPLEEIFAATAAGRTWRGEILNRRKDGGTYPAHAVVSPVFERTGRLAHIIWVVEDVSERKQAEAALVYAKERAEAGERAKGQFLAMMSHEIRTPLNGIIGFTSLFLDTTLTAEQREYLQTIRASGEALLELTNDVLDFSKIDAGRLRLELHPCDPRECAESAFEVLAARAAEKNLELLHHVEPGVPAAVLADADRLRQVLINLVGNAIKFTPAGEVEVAVRGESPGGSGPSEAGTARTWRLVFTVRDTGIGIAPETRDRLFKPFSQIDTSFTRKYGGVGLGLVISRSLVQMMGGDVTVESALGQGATFTFSVVAVEAPSVESSSRLAERALLAGRTLAVMGPSASFRRELARLAEAWGARPFECTREQLAAGEWDAALVALAPDDVAEWRRVFAQRPDLVSRPLVALAPVNFPAAGHDALRPHFRAMMRKPPRHHALRAVVAATLQPVASAAAGSPADSAARPPAALGLRVLQVEDNPVNQRLTQKILENLGCHWDLADEARLALERLHRGRYDLVLLDLQLPGPEGLSLLEAIRRGRAGDQNREIWITALTADAQVSVEGADDCVARPFTASDLEASLKRVPPTAAAVPGPKK